jgi:uncharacterized radical SAM protein YgiQ
MYLPVTQDEMKALGWDRPDVVLVTGDTYIDSPHIGVALIGKYLMKHGYKTAIIAQPSIRDGSDISRLGEPRLFWGVSAGCVDSMVANYTATQKTRHQDDYTPGGVNVRPDRASIVYTNLIRRYFKNTVPIVLGGIEASLRRIAHYDYSSHSIRRSVLLDAKADILAYGMAEKTVVELADKLKEAKDWRHIKGICYAAREYPETFVSLPAYEKVSSDTLSFLEMSKRFYQLANNPVQGFIQKHKDRYLVHNPAHPPLTPAELDDCYDMAFERDAHPFYKTGEIRALVTIRQSITTHRGCFGQCHFCAIAVHQGKSVVSRSVRSILKEADRIRQLEGFNGIITDAGGPTANMYGAGCRNNWECTDRHCLTPEVCSNLLFGHKRQMEMLNKLRSLPDIKRVFISSGLRHDLVTADKKYGSRYVNQLVNHHVSGQLKLAPEHVDQTVLSLMNKSPVQSLMEFKVLFEDARARSKKRVYLTYYLMAAHPGCTQEQMHSLKTFLIHTLNHIPRQIQIFTPTPSTLSTAMYYCGTDLDGNRIYCETDQKSRQKQKAIVGSAKRKRE